MLLNDFKCVNWRSMIMIFEKSTVDQFEEYLFYDSDIKKDIPDFDMLCVYNNSDCFSDVLIRTLKDQKCKYFVRVLAFNNKSNKFKSMAEAYNRMMKYVKSEEVIFTHQDIRYENAHALQEMLDEILLVPYNGIWGIGGVFCKSRAVPIAKKGEPVEVHSVDECLFGMRTELCRKLRFNETICNNWHMYSAEMCIHNQLENGTVYVINADNICHLSPGVISGEYVNTLYKVINYYKTKGIDTVWTTCAKVDLAKPYHIYITVWLLKHEVLNKVIRPISGIIKKRQKHSNLKG